ncbi:MAG: hypothetical protein KDA28_09600, partial [Phycisphaerales bacterium]|nr:hypothetical protein [Phycisphaerales bacterium]
LVEAPYRISFPTTNACSAQEDVYEDNDTLEDAAPLQEAVAIPAWSCQDDEDYYYIGPVGAGSTIDVDLLFTHADGDLDLWLYRDGSITWVDSSLTVDDNESLSYAVGTTDDYYLRVQHYSGSGGLAYTIRYEVR